MVTITAPIDLRALIEDLHASEINAGIKWSYDGVWDAFIGDKLNGIAAANTLPTLDAAAEWLRAKAIELCPDSAFATKHRRGFE